MGKDFDIGTEFVLRNREGGWSLEVQMSRLEDAAAILGRMGSSGPITAHIETLGKDGRYIRKGQMQIGEAPSRWGQAQPAQEPAAPPSNKAAPAASARPPSTGSSPTTIGGSLKLLVVSLAQIAFGLLGLVVVGAVVFQAWFFIHDRLNDVSAAAAAYRPTANAATTPPSVSPRSSPYSTPGLSESSGIYLADRIEALAVLFEHADACRLSESRDHAREKFVEPAIQRLKLNAADVALINRTLAVQPATTCTLTPMERIAALELFMQISAEGLIDGAFSAWNDAMGTTDSGVP